MFDRLANTFDLILNTVSAPLDLDVYLKLLRREGTMVNVGAPPEAVPRTLFTLFANRRSFAGSSTAGIAETQEMLDLCAEHDLVSETELIDASAIDEAYERVLRSDVRLRSVIDATSCAWARGSRLTACTCRFTVRRHDGAAWRWKPGLPRGTR